LGCIDGPMPLRTAAFADANQCLFFNFWSP
jgi:hypothetical protein